MTSPGAYNESNWLLPTPPSGPFNLTARIYPPKKELLDGEHTSCRRSRAYPDRHCCKRFATSLTGARF
ncbi:MAG: hypothetical protein NT115_06440 [Proteobacteria bacterium]|nr:hypothetical protein [Pseudomonadota bacterium]